jgi:hypothetical protein
MSDPVVIMLILPPTTHAKAAQRSEPGLDQGSPIASFDMVDGYY